jgi:hypothetical protein
MTYTNEYGSVNGQSCSYVRLGRYNKCSAAEVNKAPVLSTTDYTFKGQIPSASTNPQNAPVNSVMIGSDGLPVATPIPNPLNVKVGTTEGYADVSTDYVPHYNVPNYAPINTNSLTYGGNCGGYPDILKAYGGMEGGGGNCVTNFINN